MAYSRKSMKKRSFRKRTTKRRSHRKRHTRRQRGRGTGFSSMVDEDPDKLFRTTDMSNLQKLADHICVYKEDFGYTNDSQCLERARDIIRQNIREQDAFGDADYKAALAEQQRRGIIPERVNIPRDATIDERIAMRSQNRSFREGANRLADAYLKTKKQLRG